MGLVLSSSPVSVVCVCGGGGGGGGGGWLAGKRRIEKERPWFRRRRGSNQGFYIHLASVLFLILERTCRGAGISMALWWLFIESGKGGHSVLLLGRVGAVLSLLLRIDRL